MDKNPLAAELEAALQALKFTEECRDEWAKTAIVLKERAERAEADLKRISKTVERLAKERKNVEENLHKTL